jgi:hypothetical protein
VNEPFKAFKIIRKVLNLDVCTFEIGYVRRVFSRIPRTTPVVGKKLSHTHRVLDIMGPLGRLWVTLQKVQSEGGKRCDLYQLI